ncbi:hypothetical protein ABMA27_004147 [Loxostege sticticalis]|uniref:Uncharacterized protein n=1 Tax=Loxostege sticticalis TaxID=481309 RepID=A0ABR3HMK9_LOXSC
MLTEHEPHCSYDFLEIIETGVDNGTEHGEWMLEDHHDSYSAENEVWEEPEYLLPESDSTSAGWSRDAHATRARRLCGDWGGKLKLLTYQSKSNELRLRFRSDHSRHFAGYKAKITVADCEYTPFYVMAQNHHIVKARPMPSSDASAATGAGS